MKNDLENIPLLKNDTLQLPKRCFVPLYSNKKMNDDVTICFYLFPGDDVFESLNNCFELLGNLVHFSVEN